MLTDIIHTITYTLDTKVLPPYDADTDWTKAEAYRYSSIDGITDHGYIQGDVFHGAYLGDAPASEAIRTGRTYYALSAHETYLHPDNLWTHDENVALIGYKDGVIEVDHLVFIDCGLCLTEHETETGILDRFCNNVGKVNAGVDWYRLFEDDDAFQRFMKGLEH
jgi:hypothetical protein